MATPTQPCLFEVFIQLCSLRPTITTQDVAGLTVLRQSIDQAPVGRLNAQRLRLNLLRSLVGLQSVIPAEMRAAGFFPQISHPSRNDLAAHIAASRWRRWATENVDPYPKPANERQRIVRGLARLFCWPIVSNEAEAAQIAKQMLDDYFRRRGAHGSNLTREDVLHELYAFGRGELGDKRLLRRMLDGEFQLDPEAIRDALRQSRFEVRATAALDEDHLEEGDDPADAAVAADLRTQLRERSDPLNRRLLDLGDRSVIEAAQALGISDHTVRNRRRRLEETYRRLVGEPDSSQRKPTFVSDLPEIVAGRR